MKVSMLEQEREKGNAAADLIQQFVDAGFVKQGSDGNFTIPGASVTKKFKPFGGKLSCLSYIHTVLKYKWTEDVCN